MNTNIFVALHTYVRSPMRQAVFIGTRYYHRSYHPQLQQPKLMNNRVRSSNRLMAMNSTRFYAAKNTAGNGVLVEHDQSTGHFFVQFEGLGRAYLEYEREGDLMKLMHTEVPFELEGRGLGGILAKEALEHVATHGLKAEIHCDFVRHFVNKYEPKYNKYLSN